MLKFDKLNEFQNVLKAASSFPTINRKEREALQYLVEVIRAEPIHLNNSGAQINARTLCGPV